MLSEDVASCEQWFTAVWEGCSCNLSRAVAGTFPDQAALETRLGMMLRRCVTEEAPLTRMDRGSEFEETASKLKNVRSRYVCKCVGKAVTTEGIFVVGRSGQPNQKIGRLGGDEMPCRLALVGAHRPLSALTTCRTLTIPISREVCNKAACGSLTVEAWPGEARHLRLHVA